MASFHFSHCPLNSSIFLVLAVLLFFFLNVFFPSGIRFSEWNILASSKPSSPFYLKRPNFIYTFVFSSRWLRILFMILFSLISDYFWLNSEKPRQDCLIVTKAIFASSILFLVGFSVTGHLKTLRSMITLLPLLLFDLNLSVLVIFDFLLRKIPKYAYFHLGKKL